MTDKKQTIGEVVEAFSDMIDFASRGQMWTNDGIDKSEFFAETGHIDITSGGFVYTLELTNVRKADD